MMTKNHEIWDDDPPNPEKSSQWPHKQPDAPSQPATNGRWVPTFYTSPPPLGCAPIVGAHYHWHDESSGRRSLAEMKESGSRNGARWRRLCTPTRVRFDQELGIEVEV